MLRTASQLATRTALSLLIPLLAAAPAMPQAAAVPSRAGEAVVGPYRIAGKVVNAVTRGPVRQAMVSALSETTGRMIRLARTGSEGDFMLEGLPAAKYQLTASKRGYRTAFYDEHQQFSSAIVTGEGQDTGNLVFPLTPCAALRVTVTEDGGDAVENAKILLFFNPRRRGPGDQPTVVAQSASDDTGAAEFSNLAPGEYFVAVAAQPWYAMRKTGPVQEGQSPNALDVAYPVTFFDGATEQAAATPIVLDGGGHDEITINLHAVPALHLQVQVQQREGLLALPELRQPVFGAQVTVENMHSQPGALEFTGLAPGHYELTQGDPPREVELDASASQQIDPSAGLPAAAIHGALRSKSGAPLPDPLSLELVWRDPAHPREPVQTSSARGEFSFLSVPQGSWELWVNPASAGEALPVASIAANGETHRGNVLKVEGRALDLAVTVSLPRTRIEGLTLKPRTTAENAQSPDLKDAKGQSGVMVVLVPRNPEAHADAFRRDQSDSDGSFALRDVAPGEYTVVAIENGWELEWARPEVIQRFISRGIPVIVPNDPPKLMRLSQPVPVQL